MATCEECPAPAYARGYCQSHYQWHRRRGDFDNVSKYPRLYAVPAGPACLICGRNVYRHKLTEWCHVNQRMGL